jgi:hypothetical protein
MAQVDDLSASLNKHQPLPLKWGNIEDGYQWLAGESPNKSNGRFKVRLRMNKAAIFRLPAASRLQLVKIKQYFSNNESKQKSCSNAPDNQQEQKSNLNAIVNQKKLINLENLVRAEQSLDGYLFLQRSWSAGDVSGSWFANTEVHQTSAIRLSLIDGELNENDNHKVTCIEFELYYSQYTLPLKLANYRNELLFEQDKSLIKVLPGSGSQEFNTFNSGIAKQIEIEGPANLEVQVRKEILDHVSINGDINLELTLDESETQKITLEYFPELKRETLIDGEQRFISRLTKAYFFIPEGKHKLSVKSHSDIYLRLLQQQDNDYLLFGLNKPEWTDSANEEYRTYLENLEQKEDIAQITEAEWYKQSKNYQHLLGEKFAPLYQSVQKLARNNAIYNGGLAALDILKNQLLGTVDKAFVAQLFKTNEQMHGSYKNVSPVNKEVSVAHKHQRFITRALNDKNTSDLFSYHPNLLKYLTSRVKREYLESIPKASFYSLAKNQSHHFRLPTINGSSKIRILVVKNGIEKTNLKVVLDNGHANFIRGTNAVIDKNYLSANVTRQMMQSGCCKSTVNKLDNSPVMDVGYITIPIDSSVTSVTVSSVASNSSVANSSVANSSDFNWVALQVYTANSHQLDEETYVSLVKTNSVDISDFQRLVRQQIEQLNKHNDNQKSLKKNTINNEISELNNQWLPLAREFSSIYLRYSAGLDLDNVIPKTRHLLSVQQLSKLKKRALYFENSKQWSLAFETWRKITKQTKGEQQIDALFKLEKALMQQGNSRMAEKLLKALALQSLNPSASKRAFDRLYARYISSLQFDDAHNLIISSSVVHNSKKLVRLVISSMVEKGQWSGALQLAHLTVAENWPKEAVLLATIKFNWWLTYEQTLPYLTKANQLLWNGHKNFILEDYILANKLYKQAVGQEQDFTSNDSQPNLWRNFSNKILTLLRNRRFDRVQGASEDKLAFVKQWLKLSNENPSPKIWRRSPQMVKNNSGGVKLFNSQRLLSFDGYISARNKPVELEIIGPAKLRLAVRPILSESEAFKDNLVVPQNSAFGVEINGITRTYAIIDSFASSSLLIENSNDIVGSAMVNELQFDVGVHRIKIFSDKKLAIFPESHMHSMPMPGLENFDREAVIALLPNNSVTQSEHSSNAFGQDVESKIYHQLTEYLLILNGYAGQQAASQKLGGNLSQLSKNEILALAQNLVHTHSQTSFVSSRVKKVMDKISQNASWRPITNIIQSAGIRQLEKSQWQIESPNWKNYIELFDGQLVKSRILTPDKPITFNVFNKKKTEFKLKVESLRPWFLSKVPVSFSYTINDGKSKKFSISSLKNIKISVPKGNQSIKFEMKRSEYDQFLGIKLFEENGHSVESNYRRNYHLSTQNEPFEAVINGPSWIRIDRLQGENTTNQYLFIAQKEFRLRVKPEGERTESLLRIFEWHLDQQPENNLGLLPRKLLSNSVKSAIGVAFNMPIKSNFIEKSETKASNNSAVHTKFTSLKSTSDTLIPYKNYDWQDGTFSYYANFVSRQTIEDEPGSEIDEYVGIGGQYRYFQAFDDIWYKYGAEVRVRGNNDDSLAFHAAALGELNWAPLNWKLSGDFYLQQLDASTATAAKLDFSLSQLRPIGTKSSHQPKINVFTRSHKLDYSETEFIDSDIYTDYKANHLYGIKLSDRYSYKPYIDSEYYISGAILSNENIFEVDQLSANLGFRQLLGNFLLNIQLNNTQYLADKDRLLKSQQTTFRVKLGWEFWRKNRNRFEANLNFQHDFELSDNNVNLQFVYHLSSGRDYRDFSREEISFRNIRKSMMPLGINYDNH